MNEETVVDQNPEQEPTREEIVSFYNEQIDLKTLQLKLQQLNRDYAVARFEEVLAISKLAQLTAPPPPEEKEQDKSRNLKK
jgi:hypothetical protein